MENNPHSPDGDMPLYGAISTFLGFATSTLEDLVSSNADVIISGVPFDLATSGRPGSRFGPQAIRAASTNLRWEEQRWPWPFPLNDKLNVVDIGDVQYLMGDPVNLADSLTAHANKILDTGKSLLTFGGDHFVTLPLLRAHAAKHGPVGVVHFDAHTDNYADGSVYNHGTVFHHALQEGLVDPKRTIQIGIRTTYEMKDHPYQVLDAAWVNDHGPYEVVKRIHERVGTGPTYVSFDIDGLDPAFAPGTGTPVSGGMTMDCALKIIRGMVGLDLIGMDVVEVAPAYDHADITALAAATVALEYLYVLASSKTPK